MLLKGALLGAGSIVNDHMDGFNQDGRGKFIWVCDSDLNRAKEIAAKYGIEKITTDYRECINDKDLDFVDILAPNFLHKPMAIEAMEQGLAVLCEKPMALNAAESSDMAEASKKTGKRLFVKYHQRFDPVHALAKSMLLSGEFPRPVMGLATLFGNHLPSMMNPSHWRGIPSLTGGGCLFSSGSHIIDLLRFFFGDVEAISAVNRQLIANNPEKGDDNACVILEFKCGIIITFVGCWTTNAWSRSYRFWTEDKSMYIYPNDKGDNFLDIENMEGRKTILSAPDWAPKSHHTAISHFLDIMEKDIEPLYSLDECIKSMRTLELAYKASEEGKRILVD